MMWGLFFMLLFSYTKEIKRLESKHAIHWVTKTDKKEIKRKLKHGSYR